MRILATIVAVLAFSSANWAQEAARPVPPPAEQPHIDIVFCIDCSGSMGPVIETAKQKVWAIVNEVAKAKPAPVLRIGLLGYGNADRTFRPFDLTDDLDEVYKNLMTFKDEGWGDEYVGLAIHKATNEMKWSAGKQVLKVIYVVGNETARQGPAEFDYTKTAPAAIAKDIIVNAIYCGDTDHASATPTWREMARLADGQYMEIAASGGAVVVATPFDKDLAELNGKLNATYVGYGAAAAEGGAKQAAGDASAGRLGAVVLAERAVAKSSVQYSNATWDLVDAAKDAKFDINSVKEEALPEEMKKMTVEQRKAFIAEKAREREAIQKQIREVATRRDAFVKEQMSKQGLSADKAFDTAVRNSINQQAQKKGFVFEQ